MGKIKLSKNERNEVVTKGFIEDQGFVTKGYLEDQDYVTKDFLMQQNYVTKDFLMQQNYVTKDYMHDALEVLDHRMQQYITVVMEDNRAQTLKLIEAFDVRFLRLERAVFPKEFAA